MSTVTSATELALNPTAASLLGFLHMGPLTGWDLDAWVRESIGNFWNVTRSQVYRELRSLAERGLVEAGDPGRRDRTPYTITERGKEAFSEWIAGDPGPDLIRSRLLLTVFFGNHLERPRLFEMLAAKRTEHEARLAAYRELEPALTTERYMRATLRFGLRYEEAMLDWLQELEQDLAQDGPGGA
jgi:DNA-binding PadR family transcriptional regulator